MTPAADDVAGEIFIVRHGETEWSLSGQHTSRTDLPLSEEGRRRAAEIASDLASHTFSLVLCSPLRRARETCELAGFGGRAEICEDLREWEYGEYEGLTTPEIRGRDPDWNLWRDGCPSGETPEEVGRRVDRVLERLRGADGDALAFAHGHVLRVTAARWIALAPAGGARFVLGAGAIGGLGFERETEVITRWNA